MRGVHSATSWSTCANPASRLAHKFSDNSCALILSRTRASGRTAQTAATHGSPVASRHSSARSSQSSGPPTEASISTSLSRASSAGSPISSAASALDSMATALAVRSINSGTAAKNFWNKICAYASELRDAASAATLFTAARASRAGAPEGFFTSRRMLRTCPSEAIVHPGTIASSGVSAAMGISPKSAVPARNSAAHSAGDVYVTAYRCRSRDAAGSCSKSYSSGAGFRKEIAATRRGTFLL